MPSVPPDGFSWLLVRHIASDRFQSLSIAATSLGGDFFTATSGSLMFFAPEMCRSIKGAGYSGRAADLWACGVSLYMWLYHDSP